MTFNFIGIVANQMMLIRCHQLPLRVVKGNSNSQCFSPPLGIDLDTTSPLKVSFCSFFRNNNASSLVLVKIFVVYHLVFLEILHFLFQIPIEDIPDSAETMSSLFIHQCMSNDCPSAELASLTSACQSWISQIPMTTSGNYNRNLCTGRSLCLIVSSCLSMCCSFSKM